MAEKDERGRERLGRRVLARRKELGLSLREASRRAGVMRATWTGLEQGSRRTADYNFAAMERALDWSNGSMESIVRGGEPTPIGPNVPHLEPDVARASAAAPDEPGDAGSARLAVLWSDLVDVLDVHLGALGQATSVNGSQRLWAAERITTLVRRLRRQQADSPAGLVVRWLDVVDALEATIADVRLDSSVGSETRLWGVEMVVDIAVALREAQTELGPAQSDTTDA